MTSGEDRQMDITSILPADCISLIISLTSPRDACRSTILSRQFKSAADSDDVWEKFLPSDHQEILSNSVSDQSLMTSLPKKKDLYFYLCNNPILINNGTMSFALDKKSGKKCYMIRARELGIVWGNTPHYWTWPSLPESRFSEVAQLQEVWWFDIKGELETKILSSKTTYAAYLVFKFSQERLGFQERPVTFKVYFEGSTNVDGRSVVLDPPANIPRLYEDRGDGWMEIEMGVFCNENGEDGRLLFSIFDFDAYNHKHGIIILGIEFRPKRWN